MKNNFDNIVISTFSRGKVGIPKNMAEKLGLKEGDNVILRLQDEAIIIKKFDRSILQKVIE